jgi:hypothetical protein
MSNLEWPEVRSGQPITAELWNRARAAHRASLLRSGPGVRLRQTPNGTIITGATSGPDWDHPFKVSLIESRAKITPGTVNGIEPRIDDVPLSGTEGDPPPELTWSRLKVDDEGRGYIALELTCDEKWKIIPELLTIVQVASFDSEDGEAPPEDSGGPASAGGIAGLKGRRARYPLAMLRQRASGRVDVFQIVHFALQHRAKPRNEAAQIARHFFW